MNNWDYNKDKKFVVGILIAVAIMFLVVIVLFKIIF